VAGAVGASGVTVAGTGIEVAPITVQPVTIRPRAPATIRPQAPAKVPQASHQVSAKTRAHAPISTEPSSEPF
jgi:hypothetical protein